MGVNLCFPKELVRIWASKLSSHTLVLIRKGQECVFQRGSALEKCGFIQFAVAFKQNGELQGASGILSSRVLSYYVIFSEVKMVKRHSGFFSRPLQSFSDGKFWNKPDSREHLTSSIFLFSVYYQRKTKQHLVAFHSNSRLAKRLELLFHPACISWNLCFKWNASIFPLTCTLRKRRCPIPVNNWPGSKTGRGYMKERL